MMKIFYADITADEELGLSCVSLVDSPAVEKSFLCFNEQEEPKQLMFKNEAKHIITGCAIRANRPIYRISPEGEPYYIVFTDETIQKMVERFAKKQLLNVVDLQHNGETVDNVVMVESYIKDVNRGIDPIEFKDVEDKSWFVSYKINDDNLWNEIVNGDNLNGFSIECMVDLVRKKLVPTQNAHNIEQGKYENQESDDIDNLISEILEDK